jgi:hypothetical protein
MTTRYPTKAKSIPRYGTSPVLHHSSFPLLHPGLHPPKNLAKYHSLKSPPLHLHMAQSETSQVLAGRVGTTNGYSLTDTIWTPADPPHEIPPWEPHSFWPVPDSTEDAVLLVWAHPSNPPEAMDRVFFTNILCYVSDVHEKKVGLDVLQVMLMQSVLVAPANFVSRSNISPPPGRVVRASALLTCMCLI